MSLSFFEDKPTLNDLDFKLNILNNFNQIHLEEFNNLLFYGLPGSGKTIKIYALLASILDNRVYDLKNINFEEDKKIITYKSSIYHIEIDKFNLGSNEKLFIQSFLKGYSETKNIGLNLPKIIIVKNANLLSKQSQLALRKIIDYNYKTCKFIFEISNLSNLINPLKSRFLIIRVPMPLLNEIKDCIINYVNRKGYNIDNENMENIITESSKINNFFNLKKIFGYLRYYLLTGNHFKYLYHDTFYQIYEIICSKKISFISINKIREIVNEMYTNLVPMEELLYFLFNKFVDKYINNPILYEIINLTNKCDLNIKKGNKDCLHLEFYIISIIGLINK
jgi:replication factor C subunit 3/5